MESIVLDDESDITNSTENDIINLDDEQNDDDIEIIETPYNTYNRCFDDIHKEDAVFGDFIDKCLSHDSSKAMLRVINRCLVPLYQENGRNFKCTYDSQQYNRALTKAFRNIELDPNHRYSHIKGFCDFLKSLKRKRKVPFTTLSKDLKGHKKNNSKRPKLKIVGNVIHLDDDDHEVPIVKPAVSSKTVVNNVTVHEKENASTNITIPNEETDENTEEHYIEIDLCNVIYDSEPVLYNLPIDIENNNVEPVSSTTTTAQNAFEASETNVNNIQDKDISVNRISSSTTQLQNSSVDSMNLFQRRDCKKDSNVKREIDIIERTIATYKKMVDLYSLQEVKEDTEKSPYIQCEYFQTKIVKLYNRLCQITGHKSVKCRRVRLRAIDSRPELPIKKLEQLINSNIGSDGLPQFPDFEKVVDCVTDANFEDNLGWDTKKIMAESRALFIHCGRAIQRTRQRREWRDLMSLVKDETLEDPADKDPVLQAQLTMNSVIAKCKENEILDKYSSIDMNSVVRPAVATFNEMAEKNVMGIGQSTGTVCNQQKVVTNTHALDYNQHDGDNSDSNKIRIVEVFTCNKSINIGASSTVSVLNQTCGGQSSEDNPKNNSSDLPAVPDGSSCNVEHATGTVNNNLDEHGEITSLFGCGKNSQIQVISIETCEDVESFSGIESNAQSSSNKVTNDENYSSRLHQFTPEDKRPTIYQYTQSSNNVNVASRDSQTENDYIVERNTKVSDNEVNNEQLGETDTLIEIHSSHTQGKQKNNDNCLPLAANFLECDTINKNAENNNYFKTDKNIKNIHNEEIGKQMETPPSQPHSIKLEEDSSLSRNAIDNHVTAGIEQTEDTAIVKSEHTISELEKFGDDFTVTILGVLDPFLVVEISSDSDSEDEN